MSLRLRQREDGVVQEGKKGRKNDRCGGVGGIWDEGREGMAGRKAARCGVEWSGIRCIM